jgi:branched-chain amino acid transport system ATP-binding protein
MTHPMLELINVSVAFGGVRAVDDLSLRLRPNEVLGVIGPNGAGKTTFFNALTGVVQVTNGLIVFDGENIAGMKPREIAQRGVIRTFQITSIFPNLTVSENIAVAAHAKHGIIDSVFGSAARAAIKARVDEVTEMLELGPIASRRTDELSYGDQRVVEIALAMASQPKLLLLDEPTAGMSPAETDAIARMVVRLRSTVTIIIIEHDMEVIAGVADRVCVLNFGHLIADGVLADIRENRQVKEIYFGGVLAEGQ